MMLVKHPDGSIALELDEKDETQRQLKKKIEARKQFRQQLRGKDLSTLSQSEKDELLFEMARTLKLID